MFQFVISKFNVGNWNDFIRDDCFKPKGGYNIRNQKKVRKMKRQGVKK